MKIRITREIPLYVAFFCITLSWADFCINKGLQDMLEYIGLFLILYGIYFRKYNKSDIKKIGLLVIVMFFFSIGLFLQQLEYTQKIKMILSMFILASIAIMPCKYIKNFDVYLGIEKSIIAGLIISVLLSITTGNSLLTAASEGIIVKYGFNAGIEHRNFFAYILLSLFFVEYIRYRLNLYYKKINLVIIIIFILSTNSRSCILLLILFLVISNINKIKVSKYKRNIIFFIIIIFVGLAGYPIFKVFENNSETFFFRVNGLYNYIKKFGSNINYILFGNLKIAYGFSNMTYDENIRNIIGWNGSTELVIFNVLIKNGLLGFVGYIIIFKEYFGEAFRLHNDKIKTITVAIVICFLVSAFVESYVANVNHLFTVFMYILLCNIYKIDNNIQKYKEGERR